MSLFADDDPLAGFAAEPFDLLVDDDEDFFDAHDSNGKGPPGQEARVRVHTYGPP
jgi:hypothetical protein